MLINYINKITKVIAFCSLTMLTFTFLHSEIGLFDFDGNNHASHDYCEIVKNTNAHSKLLKEELPKLEPNKSLCFHFINETETQVVQVYFENTDHHLIGKQSTEIYLFNRTFLI
jgi:hypothetical protein